MATGAFFEVFGTTPHRHEQEALEWLHKALPSYPPYAAWSLFSFSTDSGHPYEVDALVLTPKCLFMIEMKAWRGKVVDGDLRKLVTHREGRGRSSELHPWELTDKKVKSFMGRVKRVARKLGPTVERQLRDLRFEAIVWLSHADGITLSEHAAARSHVIVGKGELDPLIQSGAFPGAFAGIQSNHYSKETRKALVKVLSDEAFGMRPQTKDLTVLGGRYTLADVIEEGDGYQDRWTQETAKLPRRRVRSYLAPNSDTAVGDKVQRKAEREAALLQRLEHPDILSLDAFDPDGPLGPALIFRAFDGKALDAFLTEQRNDEGRSTVTLDDRITMLRQVAKALSYCHRNDLVHGGLSPEAILVRRLPSKEHSRDGTTDLEVKLTRFGLAAPEGHETSGDTRLLTRLGGSTAGVYEAPELRLGLAPSPASDIFSLGALAYYLLSGEPPAESPTALANRLKRDDGLRLSAVRDDLAASDGDQVDLEVTIFDATLRDSVARLRAVSSPLAFLKRLEEALTVPAADKPAATELDPLAARAADVLGEGDKELMVVNVAGSGSTAQVLKVVDANDRAYALKVPLSDEHDDRLAKEAETLASLGTYPGAQGITRLIDKREYAGRTCLLIEFAGDNTLADELLEEGALSLDYARRWGQDLIMAVRTLEECAIQHRDIKPANVGLTSGASKKQKHLLLFDFSLSTAPVDAVHIGTPAYRDPALIDRGRWDDAADRWSAAVTLYEMFTGVRPEPNQRAKAGADLGVRLEPERFDPDVREGLVGFFTKAFTWDASKRFATADDMLDGFTRALYRVPEHPEPAPEEDAPSSARSLQGLGPESSVSDLNLTTRESNALDRMGVYTLAELSQLSRNRLSGVRGVGTKTALSLIALAEQVRAHLTLGEDAVPPFLPGWRGLRDAVPRSLQEKRLTKELAERFMEAGLHTTADVAHAPAQQVKRLAERARRAGATEKVADIRVWLKTFEDLAEAPTSLRAVLDKLAPPPRGQEKGHKAKARLRQFLGVEALEGFERHGRLSDLARLYGVSRQAISLELARARNEWSDDEDQAPLVQSVRAALQQALDEHGGLLPMSRAADAMMDAFAPEPDLPGPEARRAAEALVRVAIESAGGRGGLWGQAFHFERHPTEPLIAADKTALQLAKALAQSADALVNDDTVLAESVAAERLLASLEQRAELDGERGAKTRALDHRSLLTMAVASAAAARLSARNELYPKGLSPARAVMLSASTLQAGLTPDEVRRRVQSRYPEATPLPEQAELSRLLSPLKLDFNPELGQYVSRGATSPSAGTEVYRPRPPTSQLTSTSQKKRQAKKAPERETGRQFDEQLERALSDGGFRVLLWRGFAHGAGRSVADRAPDALWLAAKLSEHLGAEHLALDGELLGCAAAVARASEMDDLSPALDADAEGPSGTEWPLLVELMTDAAKHLEQQLTSPRGEGDAHRPRVLTDLGLLARYGLLELIGALAERARGPVPPGTVRPATLVLLPVYGSEGAVVDVADDVRTIAGVLPGTNLVAVPGLQSHEILEVPAAWVDLRFPSSDASTSPSPSPP